jgi:hypothetical protein
MRRPSSLVVPCAESARLSEAFPEASEAASRGTAIHQEIAAALNSGQDPSSEEARQAVRWLKNEVLDEGARAEVPLTLVDPESGETLTAGTADVVVQRGSQVDVVDWKTGRSEHVPPVEENLQLWAYAAAAALSAGPGVEVVSCHLVFVRPEGDLVAWSDTRPVAQLWDIIDAVRAEAKRAPGPNAGPWCESRCFSRHRCSAYLLPAHAGPSALAPFTAGHGLTPDNAAEALRTLEAFKGASAKAVSAAEAQLQSFVLAHGPIRDGDREWGPVIQAGRKSGPSVKECEALGLKEYVKIGAPITTWKWRAVR